MAGSTLAGLGNPVAGDPGSLGGKGNLGRNPGMTGNNLATAANAAVEDLLSSPPLLLLVVPSLGLLTECRSSPSSLE